MKLIETGRAMLTSGIIRVINMRRTSEYRRWYGRWSGNAFRESCDDLAENRRSIADNNNQNGIEVR